MKSPIPCVRLLAMSATFALSAICGVSAATIYVDASRGDDAADGSANHPFKTPLAARNHIRQLKQSKQMPAEGLTVEISGNFSSISGKILELGAKDAGPDAAHPIVWKAGAQGALMTGCCTIPASAFKPIPQDVRARLRPEAQDRVVACDLSAFGVKALKPLPAKFNSWTEMELISSGKAMTIARYPNQGWLEITNVIDRGVAPCDRSVSEWEFGVRGGTFGWSSDEAARWDVSKGVYLFGFWCYDWSSDTLRVAKIDREKRTITTEGVHTYGIGAASKWDRTHRRYFAYNMLEALDAPGEWYVDRENRMLYFYPDENGLKDVRLSMAKDALVSLSDTANLVVQGLQFKYSTGYAVSVAKSSDVRLEGLDVSWLSRRAITVWRGARVTVCACRFSQIGSTGLYVEGGDRKTLTKSGHRVVGNDIGFCGRLSRISGACLTFNGCGVTVEHNYFHDTPYIAMSYGGNEHLIQYNEIECAMLEAGDGAGIYTGRDWGSRGTILRWNYLHHFGQDGVALRIAQGRATGCESAKGHIMVEGIYLDDCDSGETIYGNFFYKTGSRAMFTGGGRDNLWHDNLVIGCEKAAHLDLRGLRRARPGSGIKDGWDLLAKIERFDYTNEPWASRYPQLIGIMNKDPLLPVGTCWKDNIGIGCGQFFSAWKETLDFLQKRTANAGNVAVSSEKNIDQKDFPQTNAVLRAQLEIVQDKPLLDVALANPEGLQDSAAFKKRFPNFPRIPLEKCGLKGYRK